MSCFLLGDTVMVDGVYAVAVLSIHWHGHWAYVAGLCDCHQPCTLVDDRLVDSWTDCRQANFEHLCKTTDVFALICLGDR